MTDSRRVEELYGIAQRMIRKTGINFRQSPDKIEDIVHEVFVNKILHRLNSIPHEKQEIFVVKTCKFESRRLFLKRSRTVPLAEDFAVTEEPDDRIESTEDRLNLLKQAIAELDLELREVVQAWIGSADRRAAVATWARSRGYSRAKGYKLFQRAKRKIKAFILAREEPVCTLTVYSRLSAKRFLRSITTCSKVASVA